MSITPFVLSIKCKCDLMSQFGENYKEKKGRKKHRMLHIIKTRFCLTVINVRKQDIFFSLSVELYDMICFKSCIFEWNKYEGRC